MSQHSRAVAERLPQGRRTRDPLSPANDTTQPRRRSAPRLQVAVGRRDADDNDPYADVPCTD